MRFAIEARRFSFSGVGASLGGAFSLGSCEFPPCGFQEDAVDRASGRRIR